VERPYDTEAGIAAACNEGYAAFYALVRERFYARMRGEKLIDYELLEGTVALTAQGEVLLLNGDGAMKRFILPPPNATSQGFTPDFSNFAFWKESSVTELAALIVSRHAGKTIEDVQRALDGKNDGLLREISQLDAEMWSHVITADDKDVCVMVNAFEIDAPAQSEPEAQDAEQDGDAGLDVDDMSDEEMSAFDGSFPIADHDESDGGEPNVDIRMTEEDVAALLWRVGFDDVVVKKEPLPDAYVPIFAGPVDMEDKELRAAIEADILSFWVTSAVGVFRIVQSLDDLLLDVTDSGIPLSELTQEAPETKEGEKPLLFIPIREDVAALTTFWIICAKLRFPALAGSSGAKKNAPKDADWLKGLLATAGFDAAECTLTKDVAPIEALLEAMDLAKSATDVLEATDMYVLVKTALGEFAAYLSPRQTFLDLTGTGIVASSIRQTGDTSFGLNDEYCSFTAAATLNALREKLEERAFRPGGTNGDD
jgi:hypothetical protein